MTWDIVYPDPDRANEEVRIGPWPSRASAQLLARAVAGEIVPHAADCEPVEGRQVHRRRAR